MNNIEGFNTSTPANNEGKHFWNGVKIFVVILFVSAIIYPDVKGYFFPQFRMVGALSNNTDTVFKSGYFSGGEQALIGVKSPIVINYKTRSMFIPLMKKNENSEEEPSYSLVDNGEINNYFKEIRVQLNFSESDELCPSSLHFYRDGDSNDVIYNLLRSKTDDNTVDNVERCVLDGISFIESHYAKNKTMYNEHLKSTGKKHLKSDDIASGWREKGI